MKLYYTGASEFEGEQKDPASSLGGWISSTQIPNGLKSNMFGSLSEYTISNDFREVIGIALKNTTGAEIADITAYFTPDPDNALAKFKIAAVQVSGGGSCGWFIETIDSNKALPYNGTFYEAEGQENAVSLGTLAADAFLGIWIMREIDQEAVAAQKTCDQLDSDYTEGNVLKTIEVPKFNIEWP